MKPIHLFQDFGTIFLMFNPTSISTKRKRTQVSNYQDKNLQTYDSENHVKEVLPTKLATWKDHYIHSSKRGQGPYHPRLNKSSQPI
jgi:hypothetical protein